LRSAKNILQKGVYGDYESDRSVKEVSLYDLKEAIDGLVVLNRCLMKGYECSCIPDKKCQCYGIFKDPPDGPEQKIRKTRFASVVSDSKVEVGNRQRDII